MVIHMKPKFKVGEKVRIRKDLVWDTLGTQYRITRSMAALSGKTCVVVDCIQEDGYFSYVLNIDKEFRWEKDWIEKIGYTKKGFLTACKEVE